jgi:hypothetical protein
MHAGENDFHRKSKKIAPQKSAHVVLTRFNVRYAQNPATPSIGIDPSWLADRFHLFEKYCLPSVMAQTEQDFRWMLFFDRATPEPFASRARALAAERAGIYPVFCEQLPLSEVKKTISDILPEEPEWLLTTRLDNDDGLHAEYVATVQAAQRFERAEVLNCPAGIILKANRAYLRRHPSNAFISLSEPYPGFQTIFSISRHLSAHEHYPVRQLSASPRWLQVVHENNISNRVRGWRIPVERAAKGFPALTDILPGIGKENTLAIHVENMTLSVLRALRDLAVIGARAAAKPFGLELRRKVTEKPSRVIGQP